MSAGASPRPRLTITGFRPGQSGIGRVMLNLINGFAGRGVAVDLLLLPGDYPELRDKDPRVRCRFLEQRSGGEVEAFRDYLRAERPAAVLSNKDWANILLVRAVAGLKERPRILFRVGIDIPAKLKRRNPLSRWRWRRELVGVYRRADALIGNSRGVSDGLRELIGAAGAPVHTIYNPLDLDRIRRRARAAPAHPWLADKRQPAIVSIGRLVRMKDQSTLIRAFGLLSSTLECRLVIFGEGRQRDKLERLVQHLGLKERVLLPGYNADPFPDLARADLFVLSSLFEGSPNALMEALALGIPAVATDCRSGPREILGDGRFGRLVPVGDHRAMAVAMRASLARPPAPEMLAQAIGRFDLDSSVEKYLSALGAVPADAKGERR